MLINILIIIGIILLILFLASAYLFFYALCKMSNEEAKREEEFSIGFLEKVKKEEDENKES